MIAGHTRTLPAVDPLPIGYQDRRACRRDCGRSHYLISYLARPVPKWQDYDHAGRHVPISPGGTYSPRTGRTAPGTAGRPKLGRGGPLVLGLMVRYNCQ